MTALDYMKNTPVALQHLSQVLHVGYKGIVCAKAGDPKPGVGSVGRGILSTFALFERLGLDMDTFDVVVYDVLGDVVCGGFAVPLRRRFADTVYVVSSEESMSNCLPDHFIGMVQVVCPEKDTAGTPGTPAVISSDMDESVVIYGEKDKLVNTLEQAMELIKGTRQKSHEALNRFNALTDLPKGATFDVDGDASMALPLVTWLYEYLGMMPLSVRVNTEDAQSTDKLKSFFQKIDCAGAWQADMAHEIPNVVFGSGAVIARLRLSGNPFTGIELSLPAGTYQHVILKAYMGCQGALYLIERIINGLAGC